MLARAIAVWAANSGSRSRGLFRAIGLVAGLAALTGAAQLAAGSWTRPSRRREGRYRFLWRLRRRQRGDCSAKWENPSGRVSGSADFRPSDFGLIRYNRNGTLDAGFGGTGKVGTDFLGDSDHVTALASLANGKAMAVGYAFASGGSTADFALARFNADGTLDHRFGSMAR